MREFLCCIVSAMKLVQGRFPHLIPVSTKHSLLTGLCYGKSQTNYMKVSFEHILVE